MIYHEKYYLLTGGEIQARAEAFRLTFIEHILKLKEVTASFGASGFSMCHSSMLISGLQFDGDVPAGFTKPNRRGMSYPKKSNKEQQEYFQKSGEVKRFPPLQDFIDWLGCPEQCSYVDKDGWSGSHCIGHPFESIEMYWFSSDTPVLLKIPDVAKYDAIAAEENKTVKDNVLAWRMNHDGAEEILYERWALMKAEHKAAKVKEAA